MFTLLIPIINQATLCGKGPTIPAGISGVNMNMKAVLSHVLSGLWLPWKILMHESLGHYEGLMVLLYSQKDKSKWLLDHKFWWSLGLTPDPVSLRQRLSFNIPFRFTLINYIAHWFPSLQWEHKPGALGSMTWGTLCLPCRYFLLKCPDRSHFKHSWPFLIFIFLAEWLPTIDATFSLGGPQQEIKPLSIWSPNVSTEADIIINISLVSKWMDGSLACSISNLICQLYDPFINH